MIILLLVFKKYSSIKELIISTHTSFRTIGHGPLKMILVTFSEESLTWYILSRDHFRRILAFGPCLVKLMATVQPPKSPSPSSMAESIMVQRKPQTNWSFKKSDICLSLIALSMTVPVFSIALY